MAGRFSFAGLKALLGKFTRATGGNISVVFAISLVPIAGGVGAAVDYSQANSVRTAMQAAADAAALGTIKTASTLSAAAVQTTAAGIFNASFSAPGNTPTVSATYDSASNAVTVTSQATYLPRLVSLLGVTQMQLSVTAKATIGAKMWQVCVIVTDPDSNHTLLVKNGSKIEFTNCMVQVNTHNWDAVEARDTSYIHSANGENCFVGDIHYGDVVPPKDPTCTFFADPFASYTVPTNTCTYTNKVITAAATLNPGTYCGGININSGANVTFAPGVYYIQDGDLTITGSTSITANNVTFLISGSSSNLNISTTGTLTLSPNDSAGQWSGFVFYYDQPSSQANKKSKGGKNYIKNATINMSGVIYLVGQQLNITNDAKVNVNPGSIIADFILPDNDGSLNLTGTINSSNAALASLKKVGTTGGGPVLVR